MPEIRAEPLSPIDAATLWPQLHRLGTEVVATRSGENLLLSSGLAAAGLTHLPRVPRTEVLGVRRGLTYRGVTVARELEGGAGWEIVCLRIAREKDDDVLTSLLTGVAAEIANRGGRIAYLRYAEGSPHATAVRRAGFMPYSLEHLHALPRTHPQREETPFRNATRADRAGIFRLYCRAVPQHIRGQEAPTQQEWRALLDSYECPHQHVLERNGAIAAWVGIGEREARILIDDAAEGAADAALDLVESTLARSGALVLAEHQPHLQRLAAERGYIPLGIRLMASRRLALLNPLKEASPVPAAVESAAYPR